MNITGKVTLSLFVACLALLILSACVDTSRQPKTFGDYLTNIYTIELWSEHTFYEFGEPVNLRATLTNISTDTITFRGKSGADPILDINIRTPGGGGPEERVWSKENSDRVKYSVTLAPQESYIITWTLPLSFRTTYIIDVLWINPKEGEQLENGIGIQYGDKPLMP